MGANGFVDFWSPGKYNKTLSGLRSITGIIGLKLKYQYSTTVGIQIELTYCSNVLPFFAALFTLLNVGRPASSDNIKYVGGASKTVPASYDLMASTGLNQSKSVVSNSSENKFQFAAQWMEQNEMAVRSCLASSCLSLITARKK